jgi:hypothetical protein
LVFSYGVEESARAVGPSTGNFDDDGAIEVPVVVRAPNQNGNELVLVDNSGDVGETRIEGVKSGRISVGSFRGSPESVFFIEQSTKRISRFTPETEQGRTQVKDVEAQAIAGIADIDSDGGTELVFGGNSPSGNSGTINYIDDSGSLEATGVQFGSNNAAGVGQPADFDNDGIARVSIVGGNQKIALIDAAGRKTVLSDDKAKKSAPAVVDYDDDSELEIVYIDSSSGELKYIDDVTSGNSVETVGNGVSAKPGAGVR